MAIGTCLLLVHVCTYQKVYFPSTVSAGGNSSLPNIVFILADDLGYNDVNYNGGFAATPNLNSMATGPNSIKFTRFYSGGPLSSPTRGTLLTGRNHNRYCMWKANTPGRACKAYASDFNCPAQYPLPTSEITVAEILKEFGYRTAVFGKWHLGDLKPLPGSNTQWPSSNPGQNGFDVWKVTERSTPTANPNCACFNTSLCILGHRARRGPPHCTNYHAYNGSGLVAHDEPIIGDDSHFIANEFASFLNETDTTETPFFAYLALHTVNKLFVAIPPYSTMYKKRGYTQKETDYFGSITAMDEAIGKIRELLSRHNLSENTMLWFTSDNGPQNFLLRAGEGGLRGIKGSLFEGGIRVPGILEWPAMIQRNRVSNFPVVTSDFLPTVCDIIGTEPPQNRTIDGISILPHIRGESESRTSPIAWAFGINGDFNKRYNAAITDNRYKLYVEYKGGTIRSSYLYDLQVDPSEFNDVSGDHPDILDRLTTQLNAWDTSLETSARSEVRCLAAAE